MVAGKCGVKYSHKPVFSDAMKVGKKLVSLRLYEPEEISQMGITGKGYVHNVPWNSLLSSIDHKEYSM